jgi:hypothetical protein
MMGGQAKLLIACLMLALSTRLSGAQDVSGIQTIKQGIQQIGSSARNGMLERKEKFMDTAGNVYEVVKDASGMATNFVKDAAGAVFDVTQLAGSFLLDSVEKYPEEMRNSARESMSSLTETAQDLNKAMTEIGSAARDAIPKLPPLKKMNQPKEWLQKFALNNLYFQKFLDTVGEQFQSVSEGLSARYCTESKVTPSKKKEGELQFPGFKLKISTKKCDVEYSHMNGTSLNCTEPGLLFEKIPGHYIAKHHSPIEFKSKDCKFEKKHGEEDQIVLVEFNGLDTFDISSVLKSVENTMVSAFSESMSVSQDAEKFMKSLPQLADLETEYLELITSGLPEVEQ